MAPEKNKKKSARKKTCIRIMICYELIPVMTEARKHKIYLREFIKLLLEAKKFFYNRNISSVCMYMLCTYGNTTYRN